MLLSERSQSGKAAYCTILTTLHSGKGKTMRDQKDWWLPEVELGGEEWTGATEDF